MFQEPSFPRGGTLKKPKLEGKDDKKVVVSLAVEFLSFSITLNP